MLEVGIDPAVLDEFNELEKKIVMLKSEKEKVNHAIAMVRKKLSSGANISYDKLES